MKYSVSDVMRVRHSLVVAESATVREVAERLIVSDCDLLFATDASGRLSGVLSESSVVRALISPALASQEISTLITRHVESLTPSAPLSAAVPLFRASGCTAIPVVNDQRQIVGLLMRRDVMLRLLHLRVDAATPTGLTETPPATKARPNPGIVFSHDTGATAGYYRPMAAPTTVPAAQKSGTPGGSTTRPHFFRSEDARRILWASEDRL